MNTKLHLSLIVVFSFIVGKSHAGETFCDKFMFFAESATIHNPVSFRLESDWSDMRITCNHHQQASEKQLCSWLVKNSSKEFMHINVDHLEACLTNDTLQNNRFSYLKKSASYTALEVNGLSNNLELLVTYQYGSEVSKPFLSVQVLRFEN
ncbi:hypothetical protein Q4561_17320 [Alteromonas sp. 1_MG-2023]|uniref:hypothetical protein n=1 Tax=Alteromonas sp. 1_MG-2023 TaxID=3062669 RepID=UPI0026E359AC|nr:hypothetical protein [Alteromonas sp. 1_MG-2023]MDO6568836.1 hypothetical protein [Alteromonas sp. 1_MG-2023]